jgi:hypothetical protein
MKRGLAVVQIALRHDADRLVGVQVNRVGIRRRAITAAPAHDLPRPGPEKVFPPTAAKAASTRGFLTPPAAVTCFAKASRMIFQFGLAIHLGLHMAGEPVGPRIAWPAQRFAGKERVMELPPGLWLNFEELGGFPRRGRSFRCESASRAFA